MDTFQPEQQNKTFDQKQQGKEKTYKQKIMLDTVQPEQQNKTSDLKQQGKRKIQAEDNDGHSATREVEENK